MRVIAIKRLRDFWRLHPDAEQALKAWYKEAEAASWRNSTDIKKRYASASIVGSDRVVFNIGGGKYRLVVHINYAFQVVYVRFIGTHRAYDGIDVRTI